MHVCMYVCFPDRIVACNTEIIQTECKRKLQNESCKDTVTLLISTYMYICTNVCISAFSFRFI